ncbi:MAG: DinB family protein [Pseudomonadota bacterium]
MKNNTDSPSSPQPNLAAPGAGLPPVQAFMLRHVLFPAFCRTTSWDEALGLFLREGERVAAAARSLAPGALRTRVLIRAPLGIEDSSRFWSAAMVLEHLIEVGTRISTGVVELTHGQAASVKADIAEVKPKGGMDGDIVAAYRAFLEEYADKVTRRAGDRAARLTAPHPWFGELTPHRWVCLGAIHQQIHRRQMERIVAGLPR